MKGHGVSGGALTVINAIATGFGSAFGIGLSTSATVDIVDEPGFTLTVNGEEAGAGFVEATLREFSKAFGIEIPGADVATVSNIPQSKGLKSSSAAANAILLAAADAVSLEADPLDLIRAGARAGIAAGVSVTGAFDDASACMLGGLVFTNNKTMTLIKHEPMKEYAVVIQLPDGTIPSLAFPKTEFMKRKEEIEAAFEKAFNGDVFSAMYENGRCVAETIGIGTRIADRALQSGAAAAGISGTGPATGILVEKEMLPAFLEAFSTENYILTEVRNSMDTGGQR